jgi:hypothetical protein
MARGRASRFGTPPAALASDGEDYRVVDDQIDHRDGTTGSSAKTSQWAVQESNLQPWD